MSFLGKEYSLEKQENFEGFVNSIGQVTEDYKKALLTYKPTIKIVKNGDSYTFTTTRPDNTKFDTTFKSGVEFDEQVREHTAKTTFTVDGNTVTQVQKFENGKVIFTFKREFSGDSLVLTITTNVWDGVARRYFKV